MSFEECLIECASNKELIAQFDRLAKTNLAMKGTPIELQIDEATGKLNSDIEQFVRFVFEFIYLPTIAKL